MGKGQGMSEVRSDVPLIAAAKCGVPGYSD